MKVYIVTCSTADSHEVIGAYSKRELADEIAKASGSAYVTEIDVDGESVFRSGDTFIYSCSAISGCDLLTTIDTDIPCDVSFEHPVVCHGGTLWTTVYIPAKSHRDAAALFRQILRESWEPDNSTPSIRRAIDRMYGKVKP